MEDRIRELEAALENCTGYIINCIGSSYCESSDEDFEYLNEIETLLGIPLTTKNSFY